jgi:hypothetical protein
MLYVTLNISSNGSGNISSRPLLLRITSMVIPRVFWCHFCRKNFVAGRHTKVAIHSLSLSLSLPPSLPLGSYMSQSSNNRAMVVPRAMGVYCLNCHVLANWNGATTQENLHRLFYKCSYFLISILSYTCMFVFASVECQIVCR